MTTYGITLSGIDAGVPISALADFQARYPQVEFAVLPKILEVSAGAEHVWLDAETGLRTDNAFDLNKSAAFVENAVRSGWC